MLKYKSIQIPNNKFQIPVESQFEIYCFFFFPQSRFILRRMLYTPATMNITDKINANVDSSVMK